MYSATTVRIDEHTEAEGAPRLALPLPTGERKLFANGAEVRADSMYTIFFMIKSIPHGLDLPRLHECEHSNHMHTLNSHCTTHIGNCSKLQSIVHNPNTTVQELLHRITLSTRIADCTGNWLDDKKGSAANNFNWLLKVTSTR